MSLFLGCIRLPQRVGEGSSCTEIPIALMIVTGRKVRSWFVFYFCECIARSFEEICNIQMHFHYFCQKWKCVYALEMVSQEWKPCSVVSNSMLLTRMLGVGSPAFQLAWHVFHLCELSARCDWVAAFCIRCNRPSYIGACLIMVIRTYGLPLFIVEKLVMD